MGRMGIVYQDVAQAARYCQGANQAPTIDNIRQHLKTGSKSTIARYLREWKENSGLKAAADDYKIPEELLQFVQGLWERLQMQADERIDHNQLEAKLTIQSLQQQLLQIQREKREFEVCHHRLEEQHHQEIALRQQLQEQLTAEQQKNQVLSERLSAYEAHHQTQEKENERLHQLLKHVQQNLEHYQNAMQQLRQEQLFNQEKLQQEYEQRLTYAQQQLTLLAQEKLNYQASYEQLKPLYDGLQNQYAALMVEKQQLYEQYQNVFHAHHHLQELQQQLNHQVQEFSEQLEIKTKLIIDLEIVLKSKENKLELLDKNLSNLEDKTNLLRHDYDIVLKEKLILEGQLKQVQLGLSKKNKEAT